MIESIRKNAASLILAGAILTLAVAVVIGAVVLATPQAVQAPEMSALAANDSRTYGAGDPLLWIPRGKVPGITGVNKFGDATNVDSGVDTDIWDGANATDDIDIWIAPTVARQHVITSTSASDDGNPVGVGARTMTIYGLTDWDTAEVTETLILEGAFSVTTTNSYVIIHRMQVDTKGATSVNVGVISARALTDDTLTAQINVGKGRTQMAIYGVPSTQTFYMTHYTMSYNKSAGTAGAIDMSLLVNPEPDSELLNFVTRHTQALHSTGTTQIDQLFLPYFPIPGPAIIKMQGNGSANDLDVSADFNGYLIDN
jgi:hypothetical protein